MSNMVKCYIGKGLYIDVERVLRMKSEDSCAPLSFTVSSLGDNLKIIKGITNK